MSIKFEIVPPRTKNVTVSVPTFVLQQDNWNDFSFQTQYHLSYYTIARDGTAEELLIGAVKILRHGQTKSDGLQIKSDFDRLDDQFCSVGQSLDYYERIRGLGELGTQVMQRLRDVIAMPQLVQSFQNEEGWGISLFRDQRDRGERFRSLAAGLVNGHYTKAPEDQQTFTFTMTGSLSPLSIDTRSGESGGFFEKNWLPERVNVVVGRNGSGKSTLLARLARVAYASPTERNQRRISDLGKLEPDGVGFPRIVNVAFSPFDSFRLPGSDDRNRIQLVKDMQRGQGRFSFIGLRDLVAEVNLSDTGEMSPSLNGPILENDRLGQTKLKSIEQLSEEFFSYQNRIADRKREEILAAAILKLERGLLSDEWSEFVKRSEEGALRAWFHRASTGHKIALLVVFGLIAHLESNSLVLFDEPETHLHPPLLAAMMHALRTILEAFESSAVVATHSPVVVQESMARHVHVVRREGEQVAVLPVATETFGESIGLITAQIFGMESNATDFHEVLDRLVKKHKTIEDIEALFKDGLMSQQARAYVLTRLSDKLQS